MNSFKILVVEDVLPLANLIKQSLVSKGCNVFIACTLEQAKRTINDHPDISAIWLDHYLVGGGSGFDLLLFLKAKDSKHYNIPVFLVSNSITQDKIEEYKEAGVVAYFEKSKHHLQEISDKILENISNKNKA